MAQFKTLQFPNTAEGQAKKVRALEYETSNGWRVVSETIVSGKFKTEKACCFFLIFAPCAFLAGHEADTITITLERPDEPAMPANARHEAPQGSSSSPPFDQRKWDALVQYDEDISSAAQKVGPLGSKWTNELAAAYMALGEKAYLPSIVEKIQARAAEESAEKSRLAAAAAIETARNARIGDVPLMSPSTSKAEAHKWYEPFWNRPWKKVITSIVIYVLMAIAVFSLISNLNPQKTSGTNAIPPASSTATSTGMTYYYIVGLDVTGDNWLALRSEPSGRSGYRIMKLEPNVLLKKLDEKGNWAHVELISGQIGWVSTKHINCCKSGG